MLKIHLFLFIICVNSYAGQLYIVKKGDTLSKIVERYTDPPPSLYGISGRLQRILNLNPAIKDSDNLDIGFGVLLQKKQKIIELDTRNSFYFDIGFGAKYFSIEQEGKLANVSIGELNPNFYSIKTGLFRGEYSYHLNYEYNKFSTNSSSKKLEDNYQLLSLGLKYKKLFYGLTIEESPVFKSNSGDDELAILSTTSFNFGFNYFKRFESSKETNLIGHLIIGLPVLGSIDSTNAKLSKISGYNISGELLLEREFSKYQNKKFFYFFKQEIRFHSYEFDVDWDTVDGTTSYNQINYLIQIGMRVYI